MASRIPKSIQEKVIAKWFQGKTRDEIARECKISSGSVSGVLQDRRRKDREFDLLRIVALQLRQLGISVESFAPLIRLRHLIKAKYADSGKNSEIEEKEIDALMEEISVFCFNQGKTVPQFGNIALTLYYVTDEFGITLFELPAFVQYLAGRATKIRKAIALLQNREKFLLNYYLITRDVLIDIFSNGPSLLRAYQDLKSRYRKIELRVKEIDAARKVTGSQSKKRCKLTRKRMISSTE